MPPAGDIIYAVDAPPSVRFDENTDYVFTNTSYSSTSGTPTAPVCGIAFTAPTSGQVRIDYKVRMESKTNSNRVIASCAVATGGTAGSGSAVMASGDDAAIETSQSSSAATTPAETRFQGGSYRICGGLTPGVTYNAYIEHKAFNATGGTMYTRGISVTALP